ncbi:MAG: 30S ribosomal protein S17 [Dehalococcoidia bacterium]|nr:30S ribosomal protein S17 [Dehalococcoidia bacterium]
MAEKIRTGRVISNKMQKTIVVAVPRVVVHPLYQKTLRRITKLYAHDPRQECQLGDLVQVVEVRPLSKSKRWLVKSVLARAAKPVMALELGAPEPGAEESGKAQAAAQEGTP